MVTHNVQKIAKAFLTVLVFFVLLVPAFAQSQSEGGNGPGEALAILIISHTDGDALGGTATLTADVANNVGATSVTFYLERDDGNVDDIGSAIDNGDGTWSLDFDTTTVSDGVANIVAEVKDESNIGTADDFISINIDNTAPEIFPIYPINEIDGKPFTDIIHGVSQIEFKVTDNLELGEYVIEVSGGVVSNNACTGDDNTDQICTADWDTTSAEDGTATLTLSITDTAGNLATVSYDVIINNTPPAIENAASDTQVIGPGKKQVTFTADMSDETMIVNAELDIVDSQGNWLLTKQTVVSNPDELVTQYQYSETWNGIIYGLVQGENNGPVITTTYTTLDSGFTILGQIDLDGDGDYGAGEGPGALHFDAAGKLVRYNVAADHDATITDGVSQFSPSIYNENIDDKIVSDTLFTLYEPAGDNADSNPVLSQVAPVTGSYKAEISAAGAGWIWNTVDLDINVDYVAPTVNNLNAAPATSVSQFNPAEITADLADNVALLAHGTIAYDENNRVLFADFKQIAEGDEPITTYSVSVSWDGKMYRLTDGQNAAMVSLIKFWTGENFITGSYDNNGEKINLKVIFDDDGKITGYKNENDEDVALPENTVFTPQIIVIENNPLDSDTAFNLYEIGSESNPTLENTEAGSGDYSVTIVAFDVAGSTLVGDGVKITIDNDAPEITSFALKQEGNIERGTSLTEDDFDYSATDNYDGDLNYEVAGLDAGTTGTKTATLTVKDDAGNSATKTLNYEVTDTVAPEISNITATELGENSAKINFETSEDTKYEITYGTDQKNLDKNISAEDYAAKRENLALAELSASTTYYYKIKATDASENSAESEIQNFTTLSPPPAPPSNPGGGGGGGGGAGANQASTFFDTVTAGQTLALSTEKDIVVNSVEVNVKSGASNVRLSAERLDFTPSTSLLPPVSDSTYKYLEIRADGLPADAISSAKITFKVSKAWLLENNIDANSIKLQRFSGSWQDLPTTKLSEDRNSITYSATTSGFSFFVITGQKAVVAAARPAEAESQTENKESETTAGNEGDAVTGAAVGTKGTVSRFWKIATTLVLIAALAGLIVIGPTRKFIVNRLVKPPLRAIFGVKPKGQQKQEGEV